MAIELPRQIDLDDLQVDDDTYDARRALYYKGDLVVRSELDLDWPDVLDLRHEYFDFSKYNLSDFPSRLATLTDRKAAAAERELAEIDAQINILAHRRDDLKGKIERLKGSTR